MTDPEVIEGQASEVPPEKALTVIPGGAVLRLSNEDRQTVFSLITAQLGEQGQTVTPEEFGYFIRVAELRGLNPLFREVHLIKDRTGRINVQTGIDGFRKLAEDTGEYLGQTETVWGDPMPDDYPIVDWRGKPGYCRVGVLRRGWDKPLYGEAWLDEDGATTDEWADGPNGRREKVGRKASAQWSQRPRTMLKKVAEARAIRAAFPRQTAGLYTDDEIHPALPATDAPGGALGPGAASESGWTPPAGPEGMQGVVEKAPDGVRQVKIKRLGDDVHPKLELVMKVDRRRVTTILVGAVAEAVDALALAEGEVVRVTGGAIEEIEWQQGKPKKKELWGATAVSVLRGGEWSTAGASAPATPDASATSSTSQPTQPTEPSATSPSRPATDAPSGPSSSSSRTADTTSSTPGPKVGKEDSVAQLRARILEVKRDGESRGRKFASLKAADEATGEIVHAVLGDESTGEIEKQLGTDAAPLVSPGDVVILVGTWKSGWIVLTFVGAPADAEQPPEGLFG